MSEEQARELGVVKFFNVQKGFGFISPNGGGKDYFFHASNVEGNANELFEGIKVEFSIGEGRKGPEATRVKAIG